jgi:hypothetical protein
MIKTVTVYCNQQKSKQMMVPLICRREAEEKEISYIIHVRLSNSQWKADRQSTSQSRNSLPVMESEGSLPIFTRCPPPVPVLNQVNPFPTVPPYFFKKSWVHDLYKDLCKWFIVEGIMPTWCIHKNECFL